jgi:hypothetical protein
VDMCAARPLRAASFRWAGSGEVGTVSSGLAEEALLGFIAALTLLLGASLLVVIRQPPWMPPPPAGESGGQHAGPESVEQWPAAAAVSSGRHSAGPPAGPAGLAEPPGLAEPDGGQSRVAGGPPWDPAPRPPGALP